MLRPGFEPGICDSKGLPGFKSYLLSQNLERKTALELYRYGCQYNDILNTGNASELLTFPPSKRRHVMKGLTAYSKWKGQYTKWQRIRNNYQLKWSSGNNSIEGFHNMVRENGVGNIDDMLEWIKQTINEFPRFANILKFNVLTGLRPQESIDSFNLLLSHKRQEYLSEDKRLIQHYKFPNLFIRRTKKAFISLATRSILELLVECDKSFTYEMLRLTITRQSKREFKMSYCRKIFATFMRNEGVEPELIDLLQGRIPNSVFVRHYYRPPMSKFNEIRSKLDKLYYTIIEK
ncbi:MAG: hypothetical protein L0H53_16185 [Candidatus Nitrosocosmicus sp.]|nr:hypothetical protein [Candidatus Nitrosocosmicus sp.]MDN5868876.1 hypothetical protein [Candidatus Nitrosocosmicus sp.]